MPLGLSPLHHERRSSLTDRPKRSFEATKLLRAQFRKQSFHVPGMLSEGRHNEVLTARGESFKRRSDHPSTSPPPRFWAHLQGGDVAKGLAELEKSANIMIDDLLWWTAALKTARER